MPKHPHFEWSDLFRNRKTEKSGVFQILKENILFQTLSPRELRYICRLVYERVYQTEEPIFKQNDRGFGMYVIAKGRVSIRTESSENDVLVTTLGPGSFFGELSLVEPENIRTATAVAQERTVVIGFFKPDLMEILERKPQLGVKILYQLGFVLGKRLKETSEKITVMSQAKPIGKVREEAF